MNINEIIGKEFKIDDIKYETKAHDKEHEGFEEVAERNHPTGVWSVMSGGKVFFPAEETVKELPPGIYSAATTMSGQVFFIKQNIISDDLVELPDDNSTKVLNHIAEFRKLKPSFEKLGYIYKRGILLYGPQGSGKTVTVIKTIRNFVESGGIAILGNYPREDSAALAVIRDFEPNKPIVLIYEDIDDTI